MTDKLLTQLEQVQGRRVLIVGDIVADQFVYGHAGRVSREAPVLVLEHEREKMVLGGAANAAHNVKALGGVPLLVGIVGDDDPGSQVLSYMESQGIDTQFILRSSKRPTTTKLRIVASGLHTTYQQMLRIDRGNRAPLDADEEKQLLDELDRAAGKCQVMIASDYGYGVFSESVITRVSAIGQSEWCKVLVDSRQRMLQFQGAYLLTPNEPEASAACHMDIRSDDDVAQAAGRVAHGANAQAVVVTRGKHGMYLLDSDGKGHYLPIYGTDEIADVTGAGDTVIAAFALAAAAGVDLPEAARLATVAAGLAVLKQGTATVTPAEIKTALENQPWPAS